MVYLEELYASLCRDLDISILVKLLVGRSTMDVAEELQVPQSHVARLRKKKLFDIPTCSGCSGPQALTCSQNRACIGVFTLGVFETAAPTTKYKGEEYQVTVSVNKVRRVVHGAWLKSKVKQKKPKLNKRHIKDKLESAHHLL